MPTELKALIVYGGPIVIAAVFFYFYLQFNPPMWLIWWRLRGVGRRAPGPQKPEKRRRPGRLARLRARLGVRHRKHRWTIGYSNFILPTRIELDALRHHALVCGATGSGKTSALELLVDAFQEKLPIVIVDCKASTAMREHVAARENSLVWTIGGSTTWDPLRGDPTSVANRLIQGEWYARDADVYRAAAERYVLWLLHALDISRLPRTPNRILEHLEPAKLLALLRTFNNNEHARTLAAHVQGLGQLEREAVAGFRARFGVVLEGIAGPNLGQGLALEDAIQDNRTVLFSLDAASYPSLATKIGAWILLDVVRIAAQRPGPCLVIVDEFSALGREGRHVVPLLARTREAGMACVVATQGIADLARVDHNLPQQITQNTAVRLALRQGSAEDQEGWSVLLGGASVPYIDDKHYVHGGRARAVSPDDLATLRTGEAFLQVMPGASDSMRKRLWIARPKRTTGVGESSMPPHAPEPDQPASTRSAWA